MIATLEHLEELTEYGLVHGTKPMRKASKERLRDWLAQRIADREVAAGWAATGRIGGFCIAWFADPIDPVVRVRESNVLFVADLAATCPRACLDLARDCADPDHWGRAQLFCGYGRKNAEGKLRWFNVKQAGRLIKLALKQ